MKNSINKIETPHPQKHHAVFRWYKLSLYACSGLITICAAINAYQYFDLRKQGSCSAQLKNSKQEIAAVQKKLQELSATKTTLIERTRALSMPPHYQPALYFKTIACAIPDDTCLLSADINQGTGMQLQGYTRSAESLKHFLKELSSSELFKSIHLTSLQPETTDSTLLRFGIQAQLQSVQD